jgi:hypothetical protein
MKIVDSKALCVFLEVILLPIVVRLQILRLLRESVDVKVEPKPLVGV